METYHINKDLYFEVQMQVLRHIVDKIIKKEEAKWQTKPAPPVVKK